MSFRPCYGFEAGSATREEKSHPCQESGKARSIGLVRFLVTLEMTKTSDLICWRKPYRFLLHIEARQVVIKGVHDLIVFFGTAGFGAIGFGLPISFRFRNILE